MTMGTMVAARVLAAVLLVVGVWYASFGIALLINLPRVTNNWIVASGDPNLLFNVRLFRMLGGGLAVLAAGLGVWSVRAAANTVAGRDESPRHWMALLLLAVLVHLLRATAEVIGGTLSPWRVASFVSVCTVYALLWRLDRRQAAVKPGSDRGLTPV